MMQVSFGKRTKKHAFLLLLALGGLVLLQYIHGWWSLLDPAMAQRMRSYSLYMTNEGQRSGPGEQGSKVKLSQKEDKLAQEVYKREGFNALASDHIAFERSLPDPRPEG